MKYWSRRKLYHPNSVLEVSSTTDDDDDKKEQKEEAIIEMKMKMMNQKQMMKHLHMSQE